MKTDMTQGKPVKVLLGFTIPVFIGNVFQQFYNMVDAVSCGKFVGTKALGGSRLNGNDHLSDHRFPSGTDSRIYRTDCAEIWCGKNG